MASECPFRRFIRDVVLGEIAASRISASPCGYLGRSLIILLSSPDGLPGGRSLASAFPARRILGQGLAPNAGNSLSQMASSSPCMLPVSAVIATTASLFGDHDDELTAGAVAAEGAMGTSPELKPIALPPIDADLGVGFFLVRHLLARRHARPILVEISCLPFHFPLSAGKAGRTWRCPRCRS